MSTQMESLVLNLLYPDIWALVFDELYSTLANDWDERWSEWSARTPSTALLPLSFTCKALRQSLLPWLFRDIRHTYPKSSGFIPRDLWKYIQILRLNDRWSSELHCWWRNELQETIPQFPHLRTVHFKLVGVSPALFRSLSNSQSLTTIILDAHPYLTEDPLLPSFPNVQRFVHVKPFRSYPSIASDCRKFLSNFIQSSLSSFAYLDVPLAVLPTDIPGGMVTRLETLKVRGRSSCSQPIWALLQVCPMLRELEIDVIPDSIMPPFPSMDFSLNETSLSDCQISKCLQNLRRLTITHPDSLDPIFSNLPSQLEYLSIPGVRFQNKGSDILPNKTLLIHMLSRCPARHLKELLFSLQEDLSSELLLTIQTRFPELRVLEIRQRSFSPHVKKMFINGELNSSDLNIILGAVSDFRNLMELRLNLHIDWDLTDMNYMVEKLKRQYESLPFLSVCFRRPRRERDMYSPWHKYVIEPQHS